MELLHFLLLTAHITLAATSKVYTGFNYGAFWSYESNAKKASDFLDGFNIAKNLSTDTPFDSARLFTCIEAGTQNDYTGAFDAAVQSKTNLLLGFWITPATRGASNTIQIQNELAALGKGFTKHGQALSDLIIGLSVGNEDVFRWTDTGESGVDAGGVANAITYVKNAIASSSFSKYMADKPIGHIDTAAHAVVDNADFLGMTAYPYWNNDSIANANTSFQGSLIDVVKRAGNRPVWITEMGWPAKGPQRGPAEASLDNLQKFWTDVGCSVFGKYNTFWFELLNDATPDQPDWGLVDPGSRQARIKNLSCGEKSAVVAPPLPSPPATLLKSVTPGGAVVGQTTLPQQGHPSPSSAAVVHMSTPIPASHQTHNFVSTVHKTATVYITVHAPPPTPTMRKFKSLNILSTLPHKAFTPAIPASPTPSVSLVMIGDFPTVSSIATPKVKTLVKVDTIDTTTTVYGKGTAAVMSSSPSSQPSTLAKAIQESSPPIAQGIQPMSAFRFPTQGAVRRRV